MTLQTLEDIEADFLDAPCMAVLGDTIQYRAAGRAAYATIRGYVDHTEALRDLGTGQVIEQDVTIELLKSDVPTKPSGLSRIRLPRIAGLTFKAANVRSDASGMHWRFEIVKTNA